MCGGVLVVIGILTNSTGVTTGLLRSGRPAVTVAARSGDPRHLNSNLRAVELPAADE